MDCVYILECSDGTLYTGWTNNLEKRYAMHQSGQGAKYTRGRLPVRLVYAEACEDRSGAMRREIAIKRMKRDDKILMILEGNVETAQNYDIYKEMVSSHDIMRQFYRR